MEEIKISPDIDLVFYAHQRIKYYLYVHVIDSVCFGRANSVEQKPSLVLCPGTSSHSRVSYSLRLSSFRTLTSLFLAANYYNSIESLSNMEHSWVNTFYFL